MIPSSKTKLKKGVIERAPHIPTNQKFYTVVKETKETMKAKSMYDATSLNECLHTGPSLQNKLCDVWVLQRAYIQLWW